MKRDDIVKFRVTLMELKNIEVKSKQAGVSVSAYVRSCALGTHLRSRLTDGEVEAYRNLSQLKGNFVRISNLIRDRFDIVSELRLTIELLNQHLTKFQ